MTCIVGLVVEGIVYIGGDSAGVSGLNLNVRKDSKVFKNGNFLIGYTSSFRMGQILRYKFSPPNYYSDKEVYEYMVAVFVEEIRKCFKNYGYATVQNNQESGGAFLVGFKNRLFRIESDYQVCENVLPFDAVGCGAEFARGSLYTSTDKPKNRILKALQAAQEFSAGVREPFIIKNTK